MTTLPRLRDAVPTRINYPTVTHARTLFNLVQEPAVAAAVVSVLPVGVGVGACACPRRWMLEHDMNVGCA